MISKKKKRKIEYNGEFFYWFVRKDDRGIPRIHILSENKKINLKYPLFDTEIPVTAKDIYSYLSVNFPNNP